MIELVGVSIPRLYAYHRALRAAQAAGETTITSSALAALVGQTISSTQIRKDLCALGPLGRRGQGYAINPLVEQLAWVLGLEHDWRIAIVGFGYLGHAFATFIIAREARFRVAAIFDQSPAVIGQHWQGTDGTARVGPRTDRARTRLQHRRHRRSGRRGGTVPRAWRMPGSARS